MSSPSNEPQLIFVLSQGRARALEWDHPCTQQESDLQSLIFDNLFQGGDTAELAALTDALEDQRQSDSNWHRNDRADFYRAWTINCTETKRYFDKGWRTENK